MLAGASCRQGKSSGKRQSRSLVVQGGEIGMVINGSFQSYTNFSMPEIVHSVRSPEGAPSLFGYVYTASLATPLRGETRKGLVTLLQKALHCAEHLAHQSDYSIHVFFSPIM